MTDASDAIRELLEELVTRGLYGDYNGNEIDDFIRNYDDDLLSPEILELIDSIKVLVDERSDELLDEMAESLNGDESDDEDEDNGF